ncbi:MAG TPA: nitrogenase iron-molybdenum cofactor biosynthesis protein NifE [Methanobacteriaceae archaeon]|nr:nitrogenase iron-molybdenum cofactor biosynthesis protein NifE [Methanobacteriaceae archaeon]
MKNSSKQSTGSESLKSSDNESLKKELTSSGSLQNSTNSHSLKASDKVINGESELALSEADDLIITEVPDSIIKTLESRIDHMCVKKDQGDDGAGPACNMASVPGAVTQRSCVYGGARVVLMPITDAIHLVHGPIGCAACTWDIRGSRSSGEELYKKGFSTNLQEKDIVFGGEKKLSDTILELNGIYKPAAIFVYSTCVVGLIGDDLKSVCREAEKITKFRVIPVQSEGFRSFNKSLGHQLACDAMLDHLIGTGKLEKPGLNQKSLDSTQENSPTLNIVGEFNVAGDLWAIKPLIEKMGITVLSAITGDSCVEEIANAHRADLNIVQCQKSSNYLARQMEEKYGIPHLKVNFFGIEDTGKSLLSIADFFQDQHPEIRERAEKIIETEIKKVRSEISHYKDRLTGKRVAVYVGGNKAWSLIRAFEELGMKVIMTGTQNGLPEDYQRIMETVSEGTLVVDDANSMELARLLQKYHPDLIVSGAKEKYMAHKLGIPFCDFNHDRITSFAGFQGFINFAKEVDRAVSSPVWKLTSKYYQGIVKNE